MAVVTSALRRVAATIVAGALTFCANPLRAADVSAWDSGTYSAIRLIAGRAPAAAEPGVLSAGLEIVLRPGWKTYWRYPGDSGVPPRFDFSASNNVADVAVAWPAPMRFQDGGGFSIGYAERVILPLRVRRMDARAPVVLRLKLDYAVCEKLCVPVDAKAELPLRPADGEAAAALAAAEQKVPRRAVLGIGDPLAIVALARAGAVKPKVIVDVKAAAPAVDLFAEGPTAEWALPLPEPVADGPAGMRRFAFELDGLPAGATAKGAALTLTAVAPQAAIEVKAHLD